ncbi:MAG: glycine cleavage system protein T [Anaerolineae bacterium]|nr:glycine cleavage system protein T [Anaerolineae bacterium]
MSLDNLHQQFGAQIAPDGIPIHYGDEGGEYNAALNSVVLMDRSHEGRLEIRGRDGLVILQRISTNDILGLPQNIGCPTILTNPNGRILDRLMVYPVDQTVWITTEPGRSDAALAYLRRQVFFNDDATIIDRSGETRLFALHGPRTNEVIERIAGITSTTHDYASATISIAGADILLLQRKTVSGGHWAVIVPQDKAAEIWQFLIKNGQTEGIRPAGSLVYNALRIRAGRPAVGRELSTDYIPLEAGLWDEVSFTKGCYTGQEIIARMESRGRLAKTMVQFKLSRFVEAPQKLVLGGKEVGTMTSAVLTPAGEALALGFVKVSEAIIGHRLAVESTEVEAEITALAGAQPPALQATS